MTTPNESKPPQYYDAEAQYNPSHPYYGQVQWDKKQARQRFEEQQRKNQQPGVRFSRGGNQGAGEF